MDNLNFYYQEIIRYVISYAPKFITAIIILLIGLWLIKLIIRFNKKLMLKKGVDETLQKFLTNLLGWVLKIVLFITVIAQLGVATTSFVAILGAAGLAIGLALQGSLANFAGGTLIMIFKPFKVGDLIEAQGQKGVVKEIEIFTTKMITAGNKLAIIPNGILSNGNIINYTEEGLLRVDLIIGVDYGTDIKQARNVLLEVMQNNENILKDPAPSVNVTELADSSINLVVRPWVTPENYWNVYFNTLEKSKEALDAAGIQIPYPHQVRIHKNA